MLKKNIEPVFAALLKNTPAPTTELVFNSNFELLVAVVLSAQATDISVNKATKVLFNVANTPEAILELGEEKLQSYVKSIGLYRTKAKNIMKTCAILVDQYGAEVPENRTALEKLPGVGRKTANVILNTAFNQPTIAVDTHIYRLARRLGLSKGNNVLRVEEDLLKKVPKAYLKDAHHLLILHGRYICTARSPKCTQCPILQYCSYKDKNLNH